MFQMVVNLSRSINPEDRKDPKSFRRFRGFINEVDLVLMAWDVTGHFGENYLAYNLIEDLTPNDPQHLELLRKAFAAAARIFEAQREYAEHPFFIFGEMLLAGRAGDCTAMSETAARLILTEEAVWIDHRIRLARKKNDRFLPGLTTYLQFEQKWLDLIAKLENPEHDPDIARVMDLFAGGSR